MSETLSLFDFGLPSTALDALAQRGELAPSGHWDEARPGGDLAPLWRSFLTRQAGLDGAGLDALHAQLQGQVQDNGITYNVYADSEDPKRPWALDLFPVLLTQTEWGHITAGVRQRMALLEAVLTDAYGPQALVAQGRLPAALVQGHPGYLHAMHGVAPVGGRHLHIAAFDLARGPDGMWWLLSQRTQAPSGLGYLLENRQLIARLFPVAAQAMNLQGLAPSVMPWLRGLCQACPVAPGETPHVALLTPGPYNETYFEHAYLARQLGMSLVQADDLTVRAQGVYLKTLSGLQRVHAILKRVDDDWLDPLELRADSTLGVPGLLNAIRAQQVLLINHPGSGFIESNALLGFMPALAEHLLSEALTLPAIPSWWCGERAAWNDAQAQLSDGVIKPSYPSGAQRQSFEPVHGRHLSAQERERWLHAIAQDPEAYTIQRWLPLSHQPVWRPSGGDATPAWQSRPLVLRVFALADAQGGVEVLPGGLARLGTREGIASMQRGGSSADVWVCQDAAPRTSAGRFAASQPSAWPLSVAHTPSVQAVSSRDAENLYWVGRYTERSEICQRLTRTALEAGPGPSGVQAWLAGLAQHMGLLPDDGASTDSAAWLRHLWDVEHTTGLAYNLAALRRAANTVRERLSVSHWQWLDELAEQFKPRPSRPMANPAQALRALSQANHHLAAITGAQTDRMSRDDAWRLLSLGRHLERLDFGSRALSKALRSGLWQDPAGFDALLALSDSQVAFHARFAQQRSVQALVALLVADPDHPQAITWVAKTLQARLRRLEHLVDGATRDLAKSLPEAQAPSVAEDGDTHAILTWLDAQGQATRTVAEALTALFFTHCHEAVQAVGH